MELWYTEEQTQHVRLSFKVKEHLFSEQSEFQKVDVLDTYEFGKLMTLDGLVMVTEKDEFIYHDMIVHVPMAVNPNIKNVLIIGGGDGGTARELMRYQSIKHVDMVEIDKMVCDVARDYFPTISSELENPRVSLYYEDGVAFIKDKENKYDLIIIDSTDPVGPGEGLFSQEFYTNCFKALTEQGILVNQNESPVYEQFAREAIRANSKLKKIFPIVEVYQAQIPTYPSGYWLFGFASKSLHPVKDLKSSVWNQLNLNTKYYNTQLHVGAFALPSYVKEQIENGNV
ncbi:spermidine synthase [Alkaliphilus metalliredigens QYMF]|uniref:Polyamine aminopropyltransferase n=1 Tax=Alkaliphilus metalliredigens (strain QYMF) TaxID=293826 RepID=SPEE_ALKMQ|nr:polyamine aminopropyltransferase [Alkaliphilus metalliredigens]A6TRI3.1 RecName: Full=Polyamine aminopropyltransferase; AltName: Full=Putrescine aminopropyltransferase; Short=PAPT; AltName: Full=Spermidine synthase; Short=SPDS; Short=SPDSY [Alkaliphilus metalliredigens QYMF]ABR48801.1 spermidine synthase [Alkaliphilus metalliredigens QYMF]